MARTSGFSESLGLLTRKYVSFVSSSTEKMRTSEPDRNQASRRACRWASRSSSARALSEAATIDGASHFRTFIHIVLPLARASIFTVIILNGVWMWNDFFISLILATKSSVATLPLGILNFFGVYSTEWGLIFASVVIAALPVVVLYLMMTRRFIAGLTAGSVKG